MPTIEHFDVRAFVAAQDAAIALAIAQGVVPARPDPVTYGPAWKRWYEEHAKAVYDRVANQFRDGKVPPAIEERSEMKITSFGTNEVFDHKEGTLSGVALNVTIQCKDIEDAKATLMRLMTGWDLSGKGSAQDDVKPATPTQPAAEKPAKAAKKEKPAPEPEPEEDEGDDVEDDDEDDSDDEDEDEGETAAEEPPKFQLTAADVKAMKECKKLREVLSYLIEKKGVKSKKALLACCKALKDKLPVLERIEDLDERVPKAADLIDNKLAA